MRTFLSTLEQIKNLQEKEAQRSGAQHSEDFHVSNLFWTCTGWFLAFPPETLHSGCARHFNAVGCAIGPLSANTRRLVASLGLSTVLIKLRIKLAVDQWPWVHICTEYYS